MIVFAACVHLLFLGGCASPPPASGGDHGGDACGVGRRLGGGVGGFTGHVHHTYKWMRCELHVDCLPPTFDVYSPSSAMQWARSPPSIVTCGPAACSAVLDDRVVHQYSHRAVASLFALPKRRMAQRGSGMQRTARRRCPQRRCSSSSAWHSSPRCPLAALKPW